MRIMHANHSFQVIHKVLYFTSADYPRKLHPRALIFVRIIGWLGFFGVHATARYPAAEWPPFRLLEMGGGIALKPGCH